jgi:hypothetical protein
MTQRLLITVLALAAPLAAGIALQGCSHKSGRSVPLGDPNANLEVTNAGARTIHVYVDRRELGSIRPGQTRAFDILNGIRPVHIRESGESTLTYYGDFNFFSGQLVGITYQPGLTHNLTVINDGPRTLHVHVDWFEVGEVPPLEQRDFLITPGLHDVHFRERGDSTYDFVGEFDFPALVDDQELVLIYRP